MVPQHGKFDRLEAESERLRVEFLRAELEISYTIATFAGADPRNSPLREACHKTASKGYSTILKLLPKNGQSKMEKSLETKLDSLRAALADLEGGKDNPGETVSAPPAAVRRAGDPADLTLREIEVLKCIAEGNSTKQVAAILGITFKTAACHRYHVMDKLGIHETANLVRYAIRQGIVAA